MFSRRPGARLNRGRIATAAAAAAAALTPATFDFDPRKGIRFGLATKLTGTGPVVTVSGTRDRSQSELLSGGIKFTVLVGGVTMDVSFDNGSTNAAAGVAIPAGSTYTPPSPNNNLTFTFAAGTYIAGDTYEITVEQWTDQIGSYVVANTTAAQQPRYFVTGLGGLPYLDTDGTDDRLVGTDAAVLAVLTNAAAFTLLQRLASDTPNAIRVAFSVANSAQALNSSRRFGTNTTLGGCANSTLHNDAGTPVVADAATTIGTGVRVLSWFSPGTTLSLEIDGSQDATINALACNPGTLTPNRYGFGARMSSTITTFWDGKIGRHTGFNSNISDRAAWQAVF